MFRRFFDEGLAQSSYLIGCERTRRAVVIDPRRDVDAYTHAARQLGLSLVYAIETHIHADFVSGAHELSPVIIEPIAGPGSNLRYPHREARDGERIMVGDVVLQFLHTPGHTPEHISILVHQPAQPARIFTGDTLFVGAVGRPDLLGEELTRQLAGELYDSLFHKLLALDSAIEVHPGHGAGSLCGAGIGSEPHSTIGQERRFNPMLQHASRDSFVAAVLADLPETPPYFPRMKRLNHDGPAVLGLLEDVAAPPVFSPGQAAEALRGGALLVDLRQPDAFGAGHPAGALNIAFGSRVGYWAGWVLPPDARVVLLADGGAGQALEARRQLMRVGSDAVEGRLESFDAWRDAGLPIGHVLQISARDLRDRVHRGDTLTILDVRTRREFQRGHVDGAVHIPVGEIADRVAEIPRRRPVATVCEGGFRSSLAASLLARAGVASVVNVTGGMSAYRALEGTA